MPMSDELRNKIKLALERELIMRIRVTALGEIEPALNSLSLQLTQQFPSKLKNAVVNLVNLHERQARRKDKETDLNIIEKTNEIEKEIKKIDRYIDAASRYVMQMLPQLMQTSLPENAKRLWALSEFMDCLCVNELSLKHKPSMAVARMIARLEKLKTFESKEEKIAIIDRHIIALKKADKERNRKKGVITVNPSRLDVREKLAQAGEFLFKRAIEHKNELNDVQLAAIEAASGVVAPLTARAESSAALFTAMGKPRDQLIEFTRKAVNDYYQPGKSSLLRDMIGTDRSLLAPIFERLIKIYGKPKRQSAAQVRACLSAPASSTAALMAAGVAASAPVQEAKVPVPHAVPAPTASVPSPAQAVESPSYLSQKLAEVQHEAKSSFRPS